jgi:hypothetical protein
MHPYHRPVRRTFTSASKVDELVASVDALHAAVVHGVCPMYMRLGPELSVTFAGGRSGSKVLADLTVGVVLGTAGSSASNPCFPIRLTSGGHTQALVGNGFVRMTGRLIGTAIS